MSEEFSVDSDFFLRIGVIDASNDSVEVGIDSLRDDVVNELLQVFF